ncbi:unnamed protein product [Boreogadus saida]
MIRMTFTMPASTSLTQRTRKCLPVWLPPVSNQIRQRRSFTQRSTLKATTLCPRPVTRERLEKPQSCTALSRKHPRGFDCSTSDH